jgi:transposase
MSRHYDQEFKDYVSKLVVEEGKKVTEVGMELDISSKTIYRWVKKYRDRIAVKEKEKGYKTPSEYEEEKKELLKRLKEMEEENAIIKKAAHIFMRGQ